MWGLKVLVFFVYLFALYWFGLGFGLFFWGGGGEL